MRAASATPCGRHSARGFRRLSDAHAGLLGVALIPLLLQISYPYYAFLAFPLLLYADALPTRGAGLGLTAICLANAAADLAAEGLPAPAAARVLAARCGLSARQARRYVEQAAAAGRRVVPETGVVFTVKLPASLAARIREQARADQVGISALVASVLAEFVSRDRPAGSGG